MSKLFLPLFLAVAAGALAACAHHKPKTAPHVYEGDAPSIRFSREPETAGGQVNAY
jgi:hypothetical protein